VKLQDLRRRLDRVEDNPLIDRSGPRPVASMTSGELRRELAEMLGLRQGEEFPDGEELLGDLENRLAQFRPLPLFGDSP